jgi:hypothetical protein
MSFDLNINNYTKNELLDLFDLPPHYDKYNVEVKENKLKDTIIKSDVINEETKIKTINFLFKVKNILLNDIGEKCSDDNESIQGIVKNLYNSSYELKPIALEDPSEHMIQIQKKNHIFHLIQVNMSQALLILSKKG